MRVCIVANFGSVLILCVFIVANVGPVLILCVSALWLMLGRFLFYACLHCA